MSGPVAQQGPETANDSPANGTAANVPELMGGS